MTPVTDRRKVEIYSFVTPILLTIIGAIFSVASYSLINELKQMTNEVASLNVKVSAIEMALKNDNERFSALDASITELHKQDQWLLGYCEKRMKR